MGWDGVSHDPLTSRYKFRFNGTEYISVADAATLDITGSFSVGFQIKPEPVSQLTCALFSKGHPTNPSSGSISAEIINGYLRTYIHASNGVNSLVYDSNTNFLNTNDIVDIKIVWDNVGKVHIVYKDSAPLPMTINTSNVNYYASPASLVAVNTNNADFEFGRATGKNPFIGWVYDMLFMGEDMTSLEVFNYYSAIQDTTVYPPKGKIVFSSNRGGTYNLYEMDEDGTNQTLFRTSTDRLVYASYSKDGSKVLYNVGSNSYVGWSNLPVEVSVRQPHHIRRLDFNGSNDTSILSVAGTDIINGGYSQNNDKIYFGALIGGVCFLRKHIISTVTTTNVLSLGFSVYAIYYAAGANFSDKIVFAQRLLANETSNTIYTINDDTTNQLAIVSNNFSEYYNPKFNADDTLIGYSVKVAGIFQVHTVNSGGGGETQITSEATDCFFGGFTFLGVTPKIIYNVKVGGVWQIFICNLNGSGAYNITNTITDEIYGDFRSS